MLHYSRALQIDRGTLFRARAGGNYSSEQRKLDVCDIIVSETDSEFQINKKKVCEVILGKVLP